MRVFSRPQRNADTSTLYFRCNERWGTTEVANTAESDGKERVEVVTEGRQGRRNMDRYQGKGERGRERCYLQRIVTIAIRAVRAHRCRCRSRYL